MKLSCLSTYNLLLTTGQIIILQHQTSTGLSGGYRHSPLFSFHSIFFRRCYLPPFHCIVSFIFLLFSSSILFLFSFSIFGGAYNRTNSLLFKDRRLNYFSFCACVRACTGTALLGFSYVFLITFLGPETFYNDFMTPNCQKS